MIGDWTEVNLAWEAYQRGVVELKEMQRASASSIAIFNKERSVSRLKAAFHAEYNQWCGKPSLRIAGGRDA